MSEEKPESEKPEEKRPKEWEREAIRWAEESIADPAGQNEMIRLLTDESKDAEGNVVGTIPSLKAQRRAMLLRYRINRIVEGEASKVVRDIKDSLYKLQMAYEAAERELAALRNGKGRD